jgi:transcriptional regulator of acetoin/glycerol metabolism
MIVLEEAGPINVERTRSAWDGFVRTGTLEPGAVRAHIAAAWRRSLDGGCDPHTLRADQLDDARTLELLSANRTLIESARPFMTALSRAAGSERHAAMLGDVHGRILEVIGDEQSVSGPEAVPGPGSLLSEAHAGANGIGSTLGHGGYVELVGPEHFIEGFHPFTCQGVPLVGASGELVGVLSTSVRRLEAANRLRDILFCAAQAVECELLARSLSEAVRLSGPRGVLIEKLRQDVVQRYAAARLHLETAARMLARGASADAFVDSAETLIQKFRTVAATWRGLVLDEAEGDERFCVTELVDALRELLETEARVNTIELSWGRADRLFVIANRGNTLRASLECFLCAMQAAGRGGRVQLNVGVAPRGCSVELQSRSHSGESRGTHALPTLTAG